MVTCTRCSGDIQEGRWKGGSGKTAEKWSLELMVIRNSDLFHQTDGEGILGEETAQMEM